MMSRILSYILVVSMLAGGVPCICAATDQQPLSSPREYKSNKQERNFIAAGNKLYRDKRFAEAEVQYRKAIEANQASETAIFNLAASLIRQGGTNSPDAPNKTIQEAQQLLSALSSSAHDAHLAELAAYNLGNLAYNAEQYQPAIEHYKNALRRNPDNDKARQNLRLAQKKLQDQQNQDKNQDKDKDKDKEQQQDKQDQQKDQNKDKNEQPGPAATTAAKQAAAKQAAERHKRQQCRADTQGDGKRRESHPRTYQCRERQGSQSQPPPSIQTLVSTPTTSRYETTDISDIRHLMHHHRALGPTGEF